MKDQIATLISDILTDMGIPGVVPEVEVPEDDTHGDYTTNVAMKLWRSPQLPQSPQLPLPREASAKWGQFRSPMEIALSVKEAISCQLSVVSQKTPDQNTLKNNQTSSVSLASLDTLSAIDRVDAVSPGFINIFLTEASLITQLQEVLKQKESYGKRQARVYPERPRAKARGSRRVMVEFAHPNTHKAFHIGHLRNITTGESIIRLLESQRYEIIRVNYQGDVGMHIAKALYALLHLSPYKEEVRGKTGIQPEKASPFQAKERVEFLGKAYAAGSKAFEAEEAAKQAIISLNALVYASAQRLARERGIDPGTTDYLDKINPTGLLASNLPSLDQVYQLWKETRQWSLDYFETIYKRVGSHYDRYYFESECLAGVDLAKAAVKKGVLKEDSGAVIFDGKPYSLDTRVFVNSKGLPTYEGKELKLATMETTEHGAIDRIIHVVGPEQASFFKVTFKAEEILGIVRPGVQYHLIYGWVKLKHGKMSSRSGNVVLGEWLLDEAKKAIYSILERNKSKDKSLDTSDSRDALDPLQREHIAEKAAVAAVKYAFLKVGTTSEIAFDIKESVNFQGDSGPYLQYTYARCRSVLRKAAAQVPNHKHQAPNKYQITSTKHQTTNPDVLNIGAWNLNAEERSTLRLLTHFPDVVAQAAGELSPSTLCTYLFKLAQSYNLFYAKHQILGNQEYGIRNQGKKKSTLLDSHDSCFMIHDSAKFRLALTSATAHVLSNGLYLLGIETLEQM